MSWAGLILTALGSLAGIVQTYYARVQFLRGRAAQEIYGGQARHEREFHRHWLRINIIGTSLAVGVLVVGIILIISSTGSPTVPHPNHTQALNTEKASPSQKNSQSISASPSAGAWSRQWGPNDLLLSDGVYSNLDSVPPNVNADNNGPGFTVYSNQFQFNDMVSWTGNATGTPTPAACDNLIAAQGVMSIKPVDNNTYCVKTNEGNMAIIVVKRIDVDVNGPSIDNMTHVLVQATVWARG